MHPATPVIDESLQPQETLLGRHQEQFLALPALVIKTSQGEAVVSRWELTDKEVERIVETRSVYLTQLTFGKPFQPSWLSLDHPLQAQNENEV